jgi:hypothetical protein
MGNRGRELPHSGEAIGVRQSSFGLAARLVLGLELSGALFDPFFKGFGKGPQLRRELLAVPK